MLGSKKSPTSGCFYFAACNYTVKLLALFALVITILGYHSLLDQFYSNNKITIQKPKKNPQAFSFVRSRILKHLKIKNREVHFDLPVTTLSIETEFEMIIGQNGFGKSIGLFSGMKFNFTFYIGPDFADIPDLEAIYNNNNVVQIVTGYIKTDPSTERKNDLFSNKKNFSSKQEAISSIHKFMQEIGSRYPRAKRVN